MAAAKPPKIFISATSGDLGSVRKVVKDALLQIGCMPVEQTDFPPDYRSVSEFLIDQVDGCDALVHLVGKRYGAEPNPQSLPPGGIRRSYTQLEYDVARKLKKKVYVFLCADDFPYDPCEPESDLKRLLQAAHRETLAEGSAKYEPVATPTQCADKVKQLRVQLEELCQRIAAEHRRQMIAWSLAVGVLCALLIMGGVGLSRLRNVQDDTKQTTQNTKQLIKSTDDLQRTGEAVREKVAQSVETQKQTTRKVESIDVKVKALLESDTLAAIAQKADVEPQQIKQLVSQSRSAGVDTLSYARRLAQEKRYDAAFGLARFVGETALLLENSDYRAAAEAFLIAARAKSELAQQTKPPEERARQFAQIDALTLRGLDAVRTLEPAERAECETLFVDLAIERGFSLWAESTLVAPGLAQGFIDQALAQVDEALARQPKSVAQQTILHRRRALYLTEKANWSTFKQAEPLLVEALGEADRAITLATDSNDVEVKTLALLARIRARAQQHTLQPQRLARETLEQLRKDCQDVRALPEVEQTALVRIEIAAQAGLATLAMVELAMSNDERNALFAKAEEQLKAALREAESRGEKLDSGRIAAMGLLRAHAMRGDVQAAELALQSANPYGFGTKEDSFAFAEFAINQANHEARACLTDITEAIKRMRQIQLDYSVAVAPRTFARAGFTLARCALANARITRFAPELDRQFGSPELHRDNARQALDVLAEKFPRTEAPGVWAEARFQWGSMMRSEYEFSRAKSKIAGLSDALTVFTREDTPIRWAEAKEDLAYGLAEDDPPRFDDALAALADAREVFDQERFPDRYVSIIHKTSMIYQEKAKAIADPKMKRAAQSQALRHLAIADHTASTRLKDDRFSDDLATLVNEIKEPLFEAERAEVDEELARWKREAAGK